jgi:AIG2-like family
MCPVEWRPGCIRRYRLRFNLEGRPKGRAALANIAKVWGVLCKITRKDLVWLDYTEAVPGRRYRHLWIEAEDRQGNRIPCITYIAEGRANDGCPSLRCLTLLHEGAHAHAISGTTRAKESRMLNATTLLADALGKRLSIDFLRSFGTGDQRIAALLDEAARLVIERLATSDALYHDAEHTALVTLVAQDILRGLRLRRNITTEDWLHFMIAALAHDLGYLRGVCSQDDGEQQIIDAAGNCVSLPRGASDAYLAPYHVYRSQVVVLERFKSHPLIDGERIARAIELTRFPVPEEGDYAETDTEAGLLRSADLIGQLADPLYPRKLNALFHEFSEIGVNETLGYSNPADVAERYPRFFWSKVEPYIDDAIHHLELTMEGRQWVSQLYSNVFAIEHQRQHMGPQLGRALRG